MLLDSEEPAIWQFRDEEEEEPSKAPVPSSEEPEVDLETFGVPVEPPDDELT